MPPKAPSPSRTTAAFLRDAVGNFETRLDRACEAVPEAEGVHALRVACRRLRSLLSLFRDYLPAEASVVRERLRELAASFSAVRDLDVLLVHLGDWRTESGKQDATAMKPIVARLAGRRVDLLRPAMAALEAWRSSPERQQLRALTQPGAKWPASSRRKIDTVAPLLLEAAHGKFRKSLDRARRRGTLERYHKLRISGKKLRYALQALTGHYGKPAKPAVKALMAIQDGFGEYLDASRAADVLTEVALGDDWKSVTRHACMRFIAGCRDRALAELEAMPALLEKLDEKRWAAVLDSLTRRKGEAN
ncbi:MAG: CHAD domain-containing protein [Planctomycetes bacterium]|nr:CHAD domain-containing protein [Planctomycetota bacterium]